MPPKRQVKRALKSCRARFDELLPQSITHWSSMHFTTQSSSSPHTIAPLAGLDMSGLADAIDMSTAGLVQIWPVHWRPGQHSDVWLQAKLSLLQVLRSPPPPSSFSPPLRLLPPH